MDLPTSSQIIEQIDAFCARHSIAPSRFGAEATGDPNLVSSLKNGASPTLKRLHRIAAYMARVDAQKVAA